jgi:hypothetical protein
MGAPGWGAMPHGTRYTVHAPDPISVVKSNSQNNVKKALSVKKINAFYSSAFWPLPGYMMLYPRLAGLVFVV